MAHISPSFLLSHPELVLPIAPWCTRLDNLEMAVLLLAQPWIAENGLRRSELERSLNTLSQDLPVGPTYFQRINRSTAALVERGQLRVNGEGRTRAFTVTPEGFAVLVINLHVLRNDPTLDGSEFELKRAIIVLCSLIMKHMEDLDPDPSVEPEIQRFFESVDALEFWGRQVVSDDTLKAAFDVHRLVNLQHHRVHNLMLVQESRARAADQSAALLAIDGDHTLTPANALERISTIARTLAAGTVPAISARSAVARYRAYLAYLEDLKELYRDMSSLDAEVTR